jgi:hypothetical protein
VNRKSVICCVGTLKLASSSDLGESCEQISNRKSLRIVAIAALFGYCELNLPDFRKSISEIFSLNARITNSLVELTNMKFHSLKDALTDFMSEAGVSELKELREGILDGHAIQDLGDLKFLVDCKELGYLSLNKCDLKKLHEFPAGLSVERLEMCDNHLHDGLECLKNLGSLEELHIGGNSFSTLESLKPLHHLKSLRILDVTDCPVVKKDSDLHSEIFKLIPSLEAFNGKDESGESVDFEDGSDDLDDYSDEDSELDSDEDDEDGSDDEDSNDSAEDDDEEEDEGSESDEDSRPAKAARHE